VTILADKGTRANVLLLVDMQVATLSILLATVAIITLIHLRVLFKVIGVYVVDESGFASGILLANLALKIFHLLSLLFGNTVYGTVFMLMYY
jgi:hypothetical protein